MCKIQARKNLADGTCADECSAAIARAVKPVGVVWILAFCPCVPVGAVFGVSYENPVTDLKRIGSVAGVRPLHPGIRGWKTGVSCVDSEQKAHC